MFKFVPIDWTAIAAIAGFLQAAITALLAISVWYAKKSLQESQSARTAEILMWAAAQMDDIKNDIQMLRSVGPDFRRWNDIERLAAARVSARMQRLAYMARNGLIDKQHLLRMWGPEFTQQWGILSGWVMDVRRRRSEPERVEDGAFTRIDFQMLAEEFARIETRLREQRNA